MAASRGTGIGRVGWGDSSHHSTSTGCWSRSAGADDGDAVEKEEIYLSTQLPRAKGGAAWGYSASYSASGVSPLGFFFKCYTVFGLKDLLQTKSHVDVQKDTCGSLNFDKVHLGQVIHSSLSYRNFIFFSGFIFYTNWTFHSLTKLLQDLFKVYMILLQQQWHTQCKRMIHDVLFLRVLHFWQNLCILLFQKTFFVEKSLLWFDGLLSEFKGPLNLCTKILLSVITLYYECM